VEGEDIMRISKLAYKLLTIALVVLLRDCATSAIATQKTVQVNGLTLAYEIFGPSDREAVLLIAGTGAQLRSWPVELCEAVVKRGYRIIVYDNRDSRTSSSLMPPGFDYPTNPQPTASFGDLVSPVCIRGAPPNCRFSRAE
jgi:hypothetical protein